MLGLLATMFVATIAPSPASAAISDCPQRYFCYWANSSHTGSMCTQYNYTGDYVEMPCLVDNSESSYEHQTPDGCDYNDGQPLVFLRDTYYSTNWSFVAGTYTGETRYTFNPVPIAEGGWYDMNNKFNRIWNLCV